MTQANSSLPAPRPPAVSTHMPPRRRTWVCRQRARVPCSRRGVAWRDTRQSGAPHLPVLLSLQRRLHDQRPKRLLMGPAVEPAHHVQLCGSMNGMGTRGGGAWVGGGRRMQGCIDACGHVVGHMWVLQMHGAHAHAHAVCMCACARSGQKRADARRGHRSGAKPGQAMRVG